MIERRLATLRSRAAEEEVGATWSAFGGRRGDWRRDLVLHVARMRGGMTLAELARHAEMSLDTVAKAVKRMQTRLARDRRLRARHGGIPQKLAGGEGES